MRDGKVRLISAFLLCGFARFLTGPGIFFTQYSPASSRMIAVASAKAGLSADARSTRPRGAGLRGRRILPATQLAAAWKNRRFNAGLQWRMLGRTGLG